VFDGPPPTPQEEDRRRLGRERKTLVGERGRHINRIKGLLFAQGVFGYEPLRRTGAPGLKRSRPATAGRCRRA
jgi:transposase